MDVQAQMTKLPGGIARERRVRRRISIMTLPTTRRSPLRSLIYSVLRPVYYPTRYYYRLLRVRTAGLRVSQSQSISMGCPHQEQAERMKAAISPRVHWKHISLHSGPIATTWTFTTSATATSTTLIRGEGRRWNMLSGLNSWTSVGSGDTVTSLPAQSHSEDVRGTLSAG